MFLYHLRKKLKLIFLVMAMIIGPVLRVNVTTPACRRGQRTTPIMNYTPHPTKCSCDNVRTNCLNFQAYGYDCSGLRPDQNNPSNPTGWLQAPFGFGHVNGPYPIGPDYDQNGNQTNFVVEDDDNEEDDEDQDKEDDEDQDKKDYDLMKKYYLMAIENGHANLATWFRDDDDQDDKECQGDG
jgi:hypothetical protein